MFRPLINWVYMVRDGDLVSFPVCGYPVLPGVMRHSPPVSASGIFVKTQVAIPVRLISGFSVLPQLSACVSLCQPPVVFITVVQWWSLEVKLRILAAFFFFSHCFPQSVLHINFRITFVCF